MTIDKQASGAMATFRCLASACEDDCCGSWGISYDRASYERLAARVTEPAEREQLFTSIRVRDGVEATPERYRYLAMRSDGKCTMLEAAGTCSIHSRYGEEYLSNTCSTYPRFLSQIGDRLEVHGMTSCPEVVRLALLSDGGAGIALGPAPDAVFGRGIPDRTLEPTNDYRSSFFLVRGLLQSLLKLERFPIASRMFFIAFFADRAREWLRDDSVIDPQVLNGLVRTLRQTSVLDQLHTQFAAIEVAVPFGISVVREILTSPPQIAPALRVLIDEVQPRYVAAGAPLDGEVEALFTAFAALRPTLSAVTAARIEVYIERFVLDHVTRGWHVNRPSLIQYVMGIFARAATIRFLLLSHPLLQAGDPDTAALDALFVRVVYSLARTIDHGKRFAEELVTALDAQGMTRLEHMIALLKF